MSHKIVSLEKVVLRRHLGSKKYFFTIIIFFCNIWPFSQLSYSFAIFDHF